MIRTKNKYTQTPTLAENLAWGIRWGLYFATGFTAIAAVLAIPRAFVGSESLGARILSLVSVIAVYYVGGIVAGSLVGLFRAYISNLLVAIVVGILATIPVSFAVGVLMFGFGNWTTDKIVYCFGFAVLWGGTISVSLWVTRDK